MQPASLYHQDPHRELGEYNKEEIKIELMEAELPIPTDEQKDIVEWTDLVLLKMLELQQLVVETVGSKTVAQLIADDGLVLKDAMSYLIDEINVFANESQYIDFWSHVSCLPTLRLKSQNMQIKFTDYIIERMSRRELYDAFVQLSKALAVVVKQDKSYRLWMKLIHVELKDFERGGIILDSDKRDVVRRMNNLITHLEQKFTNNLAEEQPTITLTDAELIGLMEADFSSIKQYQNKINYRIPLNYPTLSLLMNSLSREDVRKKIHWIWNNRCRESNSGLLVKLLTMRHLRAKLLGYSTHSHYVLEPLMSKNPDNVFAFLHNITPKLDYLYSDEMRILAKLKNGQVQPWDVDYLFSRLEEKITGSVHGWEREWFELNNVLTILFEIMERFGITVQETLPSVQLQNVWHPSVRCFTTSHGLLYLDLYPRAGKFTHMACFPVNSKLEFHNFNTQDGSSESINIVAVVGNFTEPSLQGKTYLSLREVQTMFHEFGHVIHHLLIDVPIARLSSPEFDFIEVPSQVLENFVYRPDVYTKFTNREGRAMDADIVKKLKRQNELRSGYELKRQMLLSKYDLIIHSDIEVISEIEELLHSHDNQAGAIRKLEEIFEVLHNLTMRSERNAGKKFCVPYHQDTFMPASWGHLTDYDSRYYSYIWGRIYAEDIYWNVLNRGANKITSPGKKQQKVENKIQRQHLEGIKLYSQLILSRGGSKPIETLVTKLLDGDCNAATFFNNNVYIIRNYLERALVDETDTDANDGTLTDAPLPQRLLVVRSS